MMRPQPPGDADGHVGRGTQHAAVEAVHATEPQVQRRRRADEPAERLELFTDQRVKDEVSRIGKHHLAAGRDATDFARADGTRVGDQALRTSLLHPPHEIQRHPAEVHQQHHHQRDEQLGRLQRHPQRIGQPHERQRLTEIHPLQSDTVRSVGHRAIIRQRVDRAAGRRGGGVDHPIPAALWRSGSDEVARGVTVNVKPRGALRAARYAKAAIGRRAGFTLPRP